MSKALAVSPSRVQEGKLLKVSASSEFWGIYYADREYAREQGDPMLAIVRASSKEGAEEIARSHLDSHGAGLWATPADKKDDQMYGRAFGNSTFMLHHQIDVEFLSGTCSLCGQPNHNYDCR